MTKTIKPGTEATIQMGSLFIGCTVAKVLRNGAALVLRDSKDGTEYQANRNRAGEYRYEKAYRVRLDGSGSDNRATWLD